jgi:hypothetical protein
MRNLHDINIVKYIFIRHKTWYLFYTKCKKNHLENKVHVDQIMWQDEGYSRNSPRALGLYHYLWTISPQGITHPIVWISTLTWFIRYLHAWNLLFLSNVIDQNWGQSASSISNHSKFCLSCLDLLVLLLLKIFYSFGSPILWLWACYDIPELVVPIRISLIEGCC